MFSIHPIPILVALSLLLALTASISSAAVPEDVCHDVCGSLVFASSGDLAIAANDTAITRFAYDDHRVTRAETLIGSSVFDIAWTRDACGLVTNLDYGTGFSVSRTYDRAGRLVRVGDSLGHAWSFTYSITNRPVRETFAYDLAGALTNATRRLPSGESASFFAATYDAQGRLASLGGGADAPPVAFAYDALGNRVRTGDRLLVPDHDDPLKRPLLECDDDGAVIRHYLWGPTGLLGFIDASGTLTVAHADEHGSVIALTTPEGNVLFRATYGPHGEDWGTSGANPTPFAWLGGLGVMRIDPPDNSSLFPLPYSLYLTRHRLYSPTLGRFLSADPLGVEGGLNLYAYANGDPLAYVDPLGLCAEGGGAMGFMECLARGATMGDFASDTGWSGTIGQIGVGFIPIAGQVADARDTTANLVNVWNNPTSGEAWIGLAMSGVAWVPGVGDAAKTAYKGERQAAKMVDNVFEAGTTIGRSSGPIIKTSTEARAIAKANGWTEVKGVKSTKHEVVFTDGKKLFSRDNTGHKGGVWKEVDRNGVRIRTLDANLKPIAD